MKKVLVMCISVSFIATACNWFNHKPKSDDVVVTDDSLSIPIDTTHGLKGNTLVVPDSIKKNAGKRI